MQINTFSLNFGARDVSNKELLFSLFHPIESRRQVNHAPHI